MTPTWTGDTPPPARRPGPAGWARVVLRGGSLGIVVFGGLAVLLALRLVERPVFGARRPVTPFITQAVCRSAFVILGIGYRTTGTLMREKGAVVANHVSWLDIFSLNARKRIYFVSKAEVAGWPGIGWLARATGTVFIERKRAQAQAHNALFEARLRAGHKLLFFPEGTSTDGMRVLPFKTTLFAAFFREKLKDDMSIQPVTLRYTAPRGEDPRFYGWWGDTEFGTHLLQVLSARRQGQVELIYHAPLRVSDFADRKALAKAAEDQVRAGLGAAPSAAAE